MDYVLHVFVLVGIYTVLAVSLDLLVGHTGLLSVAHAAFAGIGAYTAALLSVKCEASFFVSIGLGSCAACALSFVVSAPSARLRGDHFVIATFAFQMIVYSILNNWFAVTGGPLGIAGIRRPVILGWNVDSAAKFLVVLGVFAGLSHVVVGRLTRGPFGRVLHAIREDEEFARALGKDAFRFKLTAFAVSSALAGLAGGLYAHFVTFIDPSGFTVMQSILIIGMVVIGGAGSYWGPIMGALALVVLPEALRTVGLSSSRAGNVQQISYGVALVVVLLVRPRGLLGRYDLRR